MNWEVFWFVLTAVGAALAIAGSILAWGWFVLEKMDWPEWVYWAVPLVLLVAVVPVVAGLLT